MLVLPIITPEISWPNLLSVLKDGLGRNMAGAKDRKGMHEYAAFIATMEDLTPTGDAPVVRVMNADFSLELLTFGYLIICPPDVVTALTETNLNVKSCESVNSLIHIAMVVGTVGEWRQALIAKDNREMRELRAIYNSVLEHLSSCGMRSVFSRYDRKTLQDKTFYLEAKD